MQDPNSMEENNGPYRIMSFYYVFQERTQAASVNVLLSYSIDINIILIILNAVILDH